MARPSRATFAAAKYPRGVTAHPAPDLDRRPSRREEILAAASELFHGRGYAGVTVDQISASMGMSGPALYRHYSGKQDLLRAVVDDAVRRIEAVVQHDDGDDRFITPLAEAWGGTAHLGSILEREIAHLDDEARHGFEARIAAVFDTIARTLGADPRTSPFVARAMVAVAGSSSFSRTGRDALDPGVIGRALRALALGHGLGAADMVDAAELHHSLVRDWLPRDEAILAALPGIAFDRGGIGAVTLEAVGSSAGISGPSVYNYFDSKAALWTAWLGRVAHWSTSSLQQALAYSESPEDVMRRALDGYTEMTRRVPAFAMPVDPSDPRIPAETRTEIETMSSGYLGLWLVCAQTARPELSAREAEALFLAAHAVINTARTMSAPWAIPADAALSRLALAVFMA